MVGVKSFWYLSVLLLSLLAILSCQQPSESDTSEVDVSQALALLTLGYGPGDSATAVTQNLVLPLKGPNGVTISWASNASILTPAGVVTRPAAGLADTSVTLTATLSKKTARSTKSFPVIVKAFRPGLSITYAGNGGTGTVVDNQLYAAGQTTQAPANGFTYYGHTFTGWNTDPLGFGKAIAAGSSFTIDQRLVLYAQWTANTYTIGFDSQGGSSVSAVSATFGTTAGLPTEPTRTGYQFAGWWTSPGGQGTQWTANTAVVASLDVYAKWTARIYTLSYDSQGGTAVPFTSVSYGASAPLPQEPTLTGYHFAGWWSGKEGTGTQWTSSSIVQGNQIVFAHWSRDSYFVSFDSRGGSSVSGFGVTYGSTLGNLPLPSRLGYTFLGWRVQQFGVESPVSTSMTVTANLTLLAAWTTVVFTITFDTQGGTLQESRTVDYGSHLTLPGEPTKTGSLFMGWRTGASGTGTAVTDMTVTEDLVLYAQWKTILYTVYRDSQGGTDVGDLTVSHGSPIDFGSDPTWTGRTFGGWWTGYNGSGSQVLGGTAAVADLHLYAKWIPIIYTVIFNSQGGTPVADKPVSYGSWTGIPSPPTKTGHTFSGWCTEPNNSGLWFNFSTPITADRTLYAYWNTNQYTLTFDYQGASGSTMDSLSISYGSTPNLPAPLTWSRSNSIFDGWWTGVKGTGEQYTNTTVVTEDKTLYAHWKQTAQWIKTTTASTSSAFIDVELDSSENIYAAGALYYGAVADFGNGIVVSGESAYLNPVLVKYSASGTAQWARSVASSTGDTLFRGIAVDEAGNSYGVGLTKGSGTLDLGDGVTVAGPSGLVVKYSSAGGVLWARTVTGGTASDAFDAVSTDGAGNVYAVGTLGGTGTGDFGNGVSIERPANILVKYNAAGVAQWVRTSNVSYVSYWGVSARSSQVAVAGRVWGKDTVSLGSGVTVNGVSDANNALIVRYDDQGNTLWAKTVLETTTESLFNDVASDQFGNLYATGYVKGTETVSLGNGVTTKGVAAGFASMVVVKYSASGQAQWATQMVKSYNSSAATGIAVDPEGNTFVAGTNQGTGIFDFGNGAVVGGSSVVNTVIVKFDSSGTALWAQTLIEGYSNNVRSHDVAVDSTGNAYLVGTLSGLSPWSFGNGVRTSLDSAYVLKYSGK